MTASQQTYLSTIYILSCQQDRVLSVDVANSLKVSRASVSKVMKVLLDFGYVNSHYQTEILLTPDGIAMAEELLARHSVVARFFQETLNLSLKEAASYADAVVHRMDSEIIARMHSLCQSRQNGAKSA